MRADLVYRLAGCGPLFGRERAQGFQYLGKLALLAENGYAKLF
jgi:hypothetical protein